MCLDSYFVQTFWTKAIYFERSLPQTMFGRPMNVFFFQQRRRFNSVCQCVCWNTPADLDCIFTFPLKFRLMQIAYQINRLKLLRFNWTTQSSSLRSVSWNFKNIHMKQRERIELLIPNAKTVHNSCDSISFASNLIEYSMAKDQKFISSTWSVKIWREKKFPFCSLGNCHRNSRLI